MTSPDPRTAIAVTWHDAKQAALYYDTILPCADYDAVPAELRADYTHLRPVYRKLANEYVPDDGISEWDDFIRLIHSPSTDYNEETGWVANDVVISASAALAWLKNSCLPICKEDEYDDHYRLLYPEYYEDWWDWYEEQGRELGELPPPDLPPLKMSQAVELQLIDMQAVDTSNSPWEQVLEFRKDQKSKRMLRDMRILFDSELRDKSPAYIEDYIDSKMEKYDIARKKHGFETVTSSLQFLFDSKSVLGLAVLGAAGVLTGNWDIALGAMAGGITIETSKLTLNIIERRRDFIWWSQEADLAYIFEARKALEH